MRPVPPDSAARRYAALVAARDEQVARLFAPAGGDRWSRSVGRFRDDPRREPDRNLAAVMEYALPADTVVDVGGGAGRMGLPFALRCREVISVDPSPGMCAEFSAIAAEAGITNARAVQAAWLDDHGVEGDLVLAFNVTYFLHDITAFVEKLSRAARRRVIVNGWSVPPPNQDAGLYAVALGEPLALLPGPFELIPVLWEMGLLPDVRVLRGRFALNTAPVDTREGAIEAALAAIRRYDRLAPATLERARENIAAGLDRLYRMEDGRYIPAWRAESRELIITWETQAARG